MSSPQRMRMLGFFAGMARSHSWMWTVIQTAALRGAYQGKPRGGAAANTVAVAWFAGTPMAPADRRCRQGPRRLHRWAGRQEFGLRQGRTTQRNPMCEVDVAMG